jgi:hypothetical protein
VETAVQVLPFDELAWEKFERLCYRLAATDPACEDARMFGDPGQAQRGIDFYTREGREYSAYQCKRVAKLTAGDLANAVDLFLDDDWADRAGRLVLCTSRSAVRTQLADEIVTQTRRLQARQPEVKFEVWDAETLSLRLKERPALVYDFFGPTWRDAFIPEAAAAEASTQRAEMAATLERVEHKSLRICSVTWAPTLLRDALEELGRGDPGTYAKLDDTIGDPPDARHVVAAVAHSPAWLDQSDLRPWRILAMLAEKFGEWDAASRAWLAVADRNEGEARAGFLAAASAAADVNGDAGRSAELLNEAEQLAPKHPRVRLLRLDQRLLGPERLRLLEGVESDEPEVAALIAGHKATAYMLVPDMDEADRFLAEAQRILPDSLMVRATAVNAAIHRGRIAFNEHQTVDYAALMQAHNDALKIREELKDARRYEESVRLLMLAADALTVVREPARARALIRSATNEELAVEDAREVLGDAALRAQGWSEALALTDNTNETDALERVRASAQLDSGSLYEQNRALATLDKIVAARGREAPQAALYRLSATFGPRRAAWSDDAFDALCEAGFEVAALAGKAQFLVRRKRDYAAADALLAPHEGEAWADDARLQIAVKKGDRHVMRDLADVFLNRAVQEDRLQCAVALGLAGETDRARDTLLFVALDKATPPATRADAYAMLVPLVAEQRGDWKEAARLHAEWIELRPGDDRASAWAPRIANRTRSA